MNRKLLIFCALLFFLLTLRFYSFYSSREVYFDKQQISFHSTLLSESKFVSNRQSLTANLPNGEKIFITTDAYSSFNFGDKLIISGTLNKQLLNNKRSIWIMLFPKIEIFGNSLGLLSNFRKKVISLFDKTLPQPSGSLLLGIVFGIKEQMDADFVQDLRNVGVLHVIAASGMNVVMVGGFMSSLFSFFFKRQLALALSIFGILFYAVLSGLEPSIIRASIMGGLVFLSQIIGRQNSASYALFLAGFGMLFLSPVLISDVGFQLSFTATAGLLYLRPLFARGGKTKILIEKSIIGEDIVTTISAQIATLPILLANFGIYSLWSVVVNALVLWTVPPLMILGGIGAIFGLVFSSIGQIFIYLCLPFLFYFEKIVSIFGSGTGLLNVQVLPWEIIVGYYLILTAIVLSRHR